MKHLKTKTFVLLFLITFITQFFLSLLNPLQSAKAQGTCALGSLDPTCIAVLAACGLTDITDRIFGGDEDMCIRMMYSVALFLFNESDTPTPAPWYDPSLLEFQRKVFDTSNPDEIFGERYTYAQVNWIINSLMSYLFPPVIGSSPTEMLQNILDIIDRLKEAKDQFFTSGPLPLNLAFLKNQGLVGQTFLTVLQINNLLYLPPLPSGVQEIKFLADKFNLVSPAYAQSTGYMRLGVGMIQNLWVATRNMAFLIATLLIIVAGFMVMFRSRISPQISVTVQMMIPRIAISLVLVTFSFAIAGFVVDMMIVLIALVLGLMSFTQGVAGMNFFDPARGGLPQAITELTTGRFDFVWHFLSIWLIAAFFLILLAIVLAMVVASIPTITWGSIIIPLAGMILGLVVWSVYVWGKIIGQLVVAYITFNLLVIAGPIMIILDILPSRGGSFNGFKKWIMCLIGQVSVFTTYSLLAILGQFAFNGMNIEGFATTPRLFMDNSADFPLYTPVRGIVWSYLLFMGFMTLCPSIVASVKNMFCKTTDPSDFIQNMMKDTIGQFSKAGQETSKSIHDSSVEKYNARTAASTVPGTTTGGGGTATKTSGGG